MATVELNACRNELARDILATDDLDVLRTTRRLIGVQCRDEI